MRPRGGRWSKDIDGSDALGTGDPTEMLDQRVYMQIYAQGQMIRKVFSFTVGILDGEYADHSWQAYAPIDEIKRMRKFMFGSSGRFVTLYDGDTCRGELKAVVETKFRG